MTQHKVGTREEWLAARNELLEGEQELKRLSDELTQQRQELPWVRIDKEYNLETDEGTKTLAQLFDGRSQLLFTYSRHASDEDLLAPYYYQLLDQVPKGRGEGFRAVRHDEYEDAGA
jgi:predicted dithiol-disulfide oxidoreductase (DUF899 family)